MEQESGEPDRKAGQIMKQGALVGDEERHRKYRREKRDRDRRRSRQQQWGREQHEQIKLKFDRKRPRRLDEPRNVEPLAEIKKLQQKIAQRRLRRTAIARRSCCGEG